MYDEKAINYGLDRTAWFAQVDLTDEERALLPTIEKYIINSGYYDDRAMHEELAGMSKSESLFASFFGVTDDGQDFTAQDNIPEIALARKLNASWDEVVRNAAETVEAEQVADALERIRTHTNSNADLDVVVKANLAHWIYDDPESNRPTRIRWNKPGDPYADHAGLEEKPGRL